MNLGVRATVLAIAAFAAAACSSSGDHKEPIRPTTQTDARHGIEHYFTDLQKDLPSGVYLSRRDPQGSLSMAEAIDGGDACAANEQVLKVVYWLKGITRSDQPRYLDQIDGIWAGNKSWTRMSTGPHIFRTPAAYEVEVDSDSDGITLYADSPCLPATATDKGEMPEMIGSPKG